MGPAAGPCEELTTPYFQSTSAAYQPFGFISVSASVHSDALPDSPPGFPASQVKQTDGKDQALSCAGIQQQTVLGPRGGSGTVHRHLPRPRKSGKTVALISLILEQYRGVFDRIYIFSPSIAVDDGWIPVKKYIEQDLGVNTEQEQVSRDGKVTSRGTLCTEPSSCNTNHVERCIRTMPL